MKADRRLHLNTLGVAILAGGVGLRLRSVVADRPKVLAAVGGRPFVTRLLDQLASQGFRHVVLCTGYRGEQVQASLGDTYQGMRLSYSRENQTLGTAGALVQALPWLDSESVLAMNGDSFCQTDLRTSWDWHCQQSARATVLLTQVNDRARYGRVKVSAAGSIEEFGEKDGTAGPGWINSGVYWLTRSALAGLPAGVPLSLEREVLPSWIGHGLYGFRQRADFLDIGIPEDYARAEQFFADLREPLADKTG